MKTIIENNSGNLERTEHKFENKKLKLKSVSIGIKFSLKKNFDCCTNPVLIFTSTDLYDQEIMSDQNVRDLVRVQI